MQTCSHHGIALPFRGLLLLCLLHTIIPVEVLMTVCLPPALPRLLKFPLLGSGALLLRLAAAGLRLLTCPLAILCSMIHLPTALAFTPANLLLPLVLVSPRLVALLHPLLH